jgi:hypothetical protein
MSEHPSSTSYYMLHKCNEDCSAITCHYILLRMFSLSLPRPMRSYLVYSLMVALLFITPLYCTSLAFGFYFRVVVTIRARALWLSRIGLD